MPRPSSINHGILSPKHVTNQIDCNIPHEDLLTIEAEPPVSDDDLATMDLTSSSQEYGTVDQSFFDCQAWLNSDTEDDFYSVRGDSISCGSTSSRRSIGSPSLNKTCILERNKIKRCSLERNKKKMCNLEQKTSPEKKERLVELLQDPYWSDLVASTDINNGGLESEATSLDQSNKSRIHKNTSTAIGGAQLAIKKKRMTGTHCGCVPSLRKKKRTNLTRNARN